MTEEEIRQERLNKGLFLGFPGDITEEIGDNFFKEWAKTHKIKHTDAKKEKIRSERFKQALQNGDFQTCAKLEGRELNPTTINGYKRLALFYAYASK